MDAYLKAFKQKMQTRGNDETMDLDEAAWHLSSVANRDFGNVVDDYANFHYDTLYYNINVENGKVRIADLNALYTVAARDIESTFENLDLDNKHIRFIDADISGDGSVIMSILVSYDWIDHQWYFPDPFTLDSVLSQYFDYGFSCNYDVFTDTIESVLNLLTAFHPGNHIHEAYLVQTKVVDFHYYDYDYDPNSPNSGGYRIFFDYVCPRVFTQSDCYYYVDSYAGLGRDSIPFDNIIIDWNISKVIDYNINPPAPCHLPSVQYGIAVFNGHSDPPVD